MNLKELKELSDRGKVCFGSRQVFKAFSDKKKKSGKVFVAKDAREDVLQKLQEKNINFEFLKTKKEISEELGLDFKSEIYLVG
jgi:ribosomal protein L7Ae-like RNA K-turn-binding protein